MWCELDTTKILILTKCFSFTILLSKWISVFSLKLISDELPETISIAGKKLSGSYRDLINTVFTVPVYKFF